MLCLYVSRACVEWFLPLRLFFVLFYILRLFLPPPLLRLVSLRKQGQQIEDVLRQRPLTFLCHETAEHMARDGFALIIAFCPFPDHPDLTYIAPIKDTITDTTHVMSV